MDAAQQAALGPAWAAMEEAMPPDWWAHLYRNHDGTYIVQAKQRGEHRSVEVKGTDPPAMLNEVADLLAVVRSARERE